MDVCELPPVGQVPGGRRQVPGRAGAAAWVPAFGSVILDLGSKMQDLGSGL